MKSGTIPVKTIVRGTQLIESFVFTYVPEVAEGEETPDAVAVDLTEYTRIKMDVRRTDNPFGDLVYTLDTELTDDSVTISGDDNNVLNLIHSSAKTILFETDGEYYRDIFFFVGIESQALLSGRLNIVYNITENN